MSDISRDLKTSKWFTLSVNALDDLRRLEVKGTALRRCASTFTANCQRAIQTANFPEAMFAAGKNFQLAESLAFMEITRRLLPEEKPGVIVPPEVAARRDEILDGKCESWVNFLMHVPVYHEEVSQAAERHLMIPIIEEAMFNQVTSIWTAFETLFGDLWEDAVNARPGKLAMLNGPSTPGSQKQSKEKDLPKQISLHVLRDNDFNVSGKMGTILRDAEKVTFTKLENVREAYSRSFDDPKINDMLSDHGFRAINVVRNLIVHKAGICDDEYQEKEKGLSGKIPKLEKECRLELDGQWMTDLIRRPLRGCIMLIQNVEEWLGNDEK